MERGESLPPLSTVWRIAEVIGVPLWRMFTPDPIVSAPETLRPDARIVLDALETLPDADLRLVREMVDAVIRARSAGAGSKSG